jgi:hypothetical protein
VWFVFQISLVFAAVVTPVALWRKLGDTEYVEGLGPFVRRILGIKIVTGTNGRTYTEPPPPIKRLQISLLFGLAWAALLGGVFYWPVAWILQ